MIPLSELLIFCAVGLIIGGIARLRPRLARGLVWRLFVALAALALLLTVEGLYWGASLVLACGIGNWLGRVIERRAERFGRFARVSLPVLGGGWILVAVVWFGREATLERRTWAQLPPPPVAPSVLLIVLDNVRAESMSLYGRDRPTTPNLERLARWGICFTQARSPAPWTLPSHASMFTGQWCHKLSVSWDRALDATYPTVAEYLSKHGYATAGFVANHYYCNARYGLGRGFAQYQDYYENQTVSLFEIVRSSSLGISLIGAFGFPTDVLDGKATLRKSAEMMNRDALRWLARLPRERPFFVFLNYYDAHSPFNPPDGPDPRFGLFALPNRRRNDILAKYRQLGNQKLATSDGPPEHVDRDATNLFLDSYESCIAYLDRNIGLLFDELGRRGLLENTLVIVTSDHGEHFKEHGFLGHGLSLYRREVHVPLLIFPPRSSVSQTVDEPVSIRELAATITDLLGLGDRAPFPGLSLGRFWRSGPGAARSPQVPLLLEVGHQKRVPEQANLPATHGPLESLVADGKVYIRNHDGREELYDLIHDPLENHNLIDKVFPSPVVEHLRKLLDQIANDCPSRETSAVAIRDR
jgi:arylsulfatase A-like enzyme